MAVDAEMLEVLKAWKQTSQFSADEDWIFASPIQLGALLGLIRGSGVSFRRPPRLPRSAS